MTDDRRTAYRIAGAAIAAWNLDLVITRDLQIDPPNDVSGFICDEATCRNSWQQSRGSDYYDKALATTILAGQVSEQDFCEAAGGTPDTLLGQTIARLCAASGEQPDAVQAVLRQRAEGIVRKHCVEIEALAAKLVAERTLPMLKVAEFIAAHDRTQ